MNFNFTPNSNFNTTPNSNDTPNSTKNMKYMRTSSNMINNSQIPSSFGNTVSSIQHCYKTLLRCLQSTATSCLQLIKQMIHTNGAIIDLDSVRDRIEFLSKDNESYNIFYQNLKNTYEETDLNVIIQKLVVTNIKLCALEEYVMAPYDDGYYLTEPIFTLYRFLLRVCDERPILVLVQDDIHGTNLSQLQEYLEYFVSEQIYMVTTNSQFASFGSSDESNYIPYVGQGRGTRLTSSTVTSKRARYQTLLRCLQSTSLCCLQILMILFHDENLRKPQSHHNSNNNLNNNPNSTLVLTTPEEVRKQAIILLDDKKSFATFQVGITQMFAQNNMEMIIQIVVSTNLALANLETYVQPPDMNGCYIHNPLKLLYKFLLRLVYEKPIIILRFDDARGQFCQHIQQCMEHFISEQIYIKRTEFILPTKSEPGCGNNDDDDEHDNEKNYEKDHEETSNDEKQEENKQQFHEQQVQLPRNTVYDSIITTPQTEPKKSKKRDLTEMINIDLPGFPKPFPILDFVKKEIP